MQESAQCGLDLFGLLGVLKLGATVPIGLLLKHARLDVFGKQQDAYLIQCGASGIVLLQQFRAGAGVVDHALKAIDLAGYSVQPLLGRVCRLVLHANDDYT